MAPVTSLLWERGSRDLEDEPNTHGRDLLLGGRAPRAGEVMKMPHLAETFRVRLILVQYSGTPSNITGTYRRFYIGVLISKAVEFTGLG